MKIGCKMRKQVRGENYNWEKRQEQREKRRDRRKEKEKKGIRKYLAKWNVVKIILL